MRISKNYCGSVLCFKQENRACKPTLAADSSGNVLYSVPVLAFQLIGNDL